MEFIFSDGKDKDFKELCVELDMDLDMQLGGEGKRNEYLKFNNTDDIKDVCIIYNEGKAVGCGAFKKYDSEYAELKRVFVKKEFRNGTLSLELVEKLGKRAKENGFKGFILETGKGYKAAVRFYIKNGFEIIPNFGEFAGMDSSVCMKKDF